MAGVTLTVDSTVVDAANTAFVINDNSTRFLLAEDYPLPEPQVVWATPIDADGDIPAHTRYGNRSGCQVKFAIQGTSAANLETTLGQWSQKLAKLNDVGGTLLRATPAGTSYYLPVFPGTAGVNFDRRYVKNNRAEVTWTFPAGDSWLAAAETDMGDNVETTLPVLIFSETIAGDLPAAPSRLVVDEDSAVSQQWAVWGMENNALYDTTAATGALFYEAEARTLLSSSAIVTLAGSSGGGTNNAIESAGLAPFDIPIWSTQATGGGAHLTHVGEFIVYARVMNTAAASGTVTFALEWAVGDFSTYTRNAPVTLNSTVAGTFSLKNLGLVTIPTPKTGANRWEGRIVAHADAGDKLRVDHVFLVPTSAGWGEIAATSQPPPTTAPSVYDLFAQTAGALTGKTSSSGHVWTAFTGDADDWALDTTNHIVTRVAASDPGSRLGRVITAGTGTFQVLTGAVDINWSNAAPAAGFNVGSGFAFRMIDTSNYAFVAMEAAPTGLYMTLWRFIAGSLGSGTAGFGPLAFAASAWYTLTVDVTAAGRTRAWWNPRGATLGSPVFDQVISFLAPGGALAAAGKIGAYDNNDGATVFNRSMENFVVSTPAAAADAVMFASQSMQIRHDGVIREDSTGTFWQNVASYEGDLLRPPAAGRENRTTRIIVKASRSNPASGADSAIDDISARLFVKPRYLTVPSP